MAIAELGIIPPDLLQPVKLGITLARPKRFPGCPIAKSQSRLEQWLPEFGDSKRT